jgi:uncharacterized protein
MTESTVPVIHNARHDLIDALRGFALAGVLMVNLASFTQFDFLDEPARAALPTAGFDAVALQVMELLVNIKAITLFSLLFGLGFAIQLERAEARGTDGRRRFVRRLLWLGAIGLIHSYLIWWGDILLTYAAVGLLLVLFRRASDRSLLVFGIAFALLAPPLLSPWMREWLVWLPRQSVMFGQALRGFSSPRFLDALSTNIDMASWARVWNWALIWFVLGRWAGRRQLFQQPERQRPLIQRIFVVSLLISVLSAGLQLLQEPMRAAFPLLASDTARFITRVLLRAGPLALGIAYATGFTLLYIKPRWNRALRVLAPAGRMALTHYLTQSIYCIVIFYGFALGIGTRLGVQGWLLAWLLVYGAQVAYIHWWLARFRFGPVEWLWRSLTYGALQPMRVKPAIQSDAIQCGPA